MKTFYKIMFNTAGTPIAIYVSYVKFLRTSMF